jgi:hypothetical protein
MTRAGLVAAVIVALGTLWGAPVATAHGAPFGGTAPAPVRASYVNLTILRVINYGYGRWIIDVKNTGIQSSGATTLQLNCDGGFSLPVNTNRAAYVTVGALGAGEVRRVPMSWSGPNPRYNTCKVDEVNDHLCGYAAAKIDSYKNVVETNEKDNAMLAPQGSDWLTANVAQPECNVQQIDPNL